MTNMKRYLLLAAVVIFTSCGGEKTTETAKETAPQAATYNPYSKSVITHQIFRVDSVDNSGVRGWGYNIMVDGKIYIHQPTIPAIMGNNGFSSEDKASKAAEFVIYKIRNNVIPPSVSPEELDSLEVLD